MVADNQDYNLFFKFIETFLPVGFKGIDRDDSLLKQLEILMEYNNQFFYVADIIQMRVIFTSKRSIEMIGIKPEEVTPYHFMEAAHPNDVQRLNLGRSKIIKLAQEIFIKERGFVIMSTNYRFRNPEGKYSDILVQGYLFYTTIPYNTVFFFKLHTNIDWHKKIKNAFHYYIGNDLSYFRYPDEVLLKSGHVFTEREFEIIRLIESGLSSEQIAEKLFLSPYTVNTHRANILQKSGKTHISDLIYDLKEQGLL
jgi:DNA-binding CsgD family transcriptional regulator